MQIKSEDLPKLKAELNEEIHAWPWRSSVWPRSYTVRGQIFYFMVSKKRPQLKILRLSSDRSSVLIQIWTRMASYWQTHIVYQHARHRETVLSRWYNQICVNEGSRCCACRCLRRSSEWFGISPHLLAEMQQECQKLLPICREAIAAGKRAVIKTRGTDVQLFINNQLL